VVSYFPNQKDEPCFSSAARLLNWGCSDFTIPFREWANTFRPHSQMSETVLENSAKIKSSGEPEKPF
jgi:hypothetical protein